MLFFSQLKCKCEGERRCLADLGWGVGREGRGGSVLLGCVVIGVGVCEEGCHH